MLIKLKEAGEAFIDVGTAISITLVIVALMVTAYIIWMLNDKLINTGTSAALNNSIGNVTALFDTSIGLFAIVILVWLLALALMALIVLKKKAE